MTLFPEKYKQPLGISDLSTILLFKYIVLENKGFDHGFYYRGR